MATRTDNYGAQFLYDFLRRLVHVYTAVKNGVHFVIFFSEFVNQTIYLNKFYAYVKPANLFPLREM